MLYKKNTKDINMLIGTGIGLSVGSSILSDSGASAEPLTRVSKGLNVAGGVLGMKIALDALNSIPKGKRKY